MQRESVRPGAGSSLAQDARFWGAHRLWSTPNVPNGGRTRTPEETASRGATGKGKRQIGLEDEARFWQTPKAISGGANSQRESRGAGGPDLQERAANWPTPGAEQYGGTAAQHLARKKKMADGANRKTVSELNAFVSAWPTPRAEDSESCGNHPGAVDLLTGASALWRSPTSRDWKGESAKSWQGRTDGGDPTPTLADQVAILGRQGQTTGPDGLTYSLSDLTWRRRYLASLIATWLSQRFGGLSAGCSRLETGDPVGDVPEWWPSDWLTLFSSRRLNPQFVEWLMGWPVGWTDFAPVETASLLSKPSMRSDSCSSG